MPKHTTHFSNTFMVSRKRIKKPLTIPKNYKAVNKKFKMISYTTNRTKAQITPMAVAFGKQ
jgi:hypothetical protein